MMSVLAEASHLKLAVEVIVPESLDFFSMMIGFAFLNDVIGMCISLKKGTPVSSNWREV